MKYNLLNIVINCLYGASANALVAYQLHDRGALPAQIKFQTMTLSRTISEPTRLMGAMRKL